MRLLLSCYACEPNRGSEPGIGWNWALGMARRHETTVLVNPIHREAIERWLAENALPPEQTPKFVFVETAGFIFRRLGVNTLSLKLHYPLWQWKARSVVNAMSPRPDVIHHLTWSAFTLPGFWWKRKEKVVLGPLGGFSLVPFPFLRLFPPLKRVAELARHFLRKAWMNPFFLIARRNADAMIFTTNETMRKYSGNGIAFASLDFAVPQLMFSVDRDVPPIKERFFAWAGVLEPRKGLEIALRAFAKAFPNTTDRPRFLIMGNGWEMERHKRLALKLGIANSVEFYGNLPQNELWQNIRKSTALVFSSVRDTCGCVNIEALALQTPVICFNHQGVGDLTDDSCAIRIPPSGWDESIGAFAEAMKKLDSDSTLAARMGAAGRKRMQEHFSFEQKFDAFDKIYADITAKTGDLHGTR